MNASVFAQSTRPFKGLFGWPRLTLTTQVFVALVLGVVVACCGRRGR
ncbi:MAG: hypothetical protein U0003_00065 [Vampirovibrionales bacterium]